MHINFQNPYLESEDPGRRVAAIDATVAKLAAYAQSVEEVHKTLSARLADVEERLAGERRDPRQLQEERDDLREAIAQLTRGVTEYDGTLPELVRFVNMPSLAETRATIAALEADRAEWLPLRDTPDAVRLYRFRPDVGDHWVDGERMFAGETTQLTLRQYRAFSDKFDPVVEPEVDAPVPVEEIVEALVEVSTGG
jgi:hypothetical protein